MSERWEVDVCGYIIAGPGGELALPKGIAHDIAARLNGPSPAEVAALLRELEWRNMLHGERNCPGCSTPEGYGHERDCKLDAMIKQCEGA